MSAPAWVNTLVTAFQKMPSLVTVLAVAGSYMLLWYAYNGGLARADELQELNARVDSLSEDLKGLKGQVLDGRIEALAGQLFEARVSQCRAETEEMKKVYGKRVVSLQESFRDLTGYAMSLLDCGDL